MENIFESNSSANAENNSYQDLSYESESYPNFHGNVSAELNPLNVKMFQMGNQSLPSPPSTPMGLKNIADVLSPEKNSYSSQLHSNYIMSNYHNTIPSYQTSRYGYESDHMTAAAAVAAAQSQPFYPQEPSINSMSMEALMAPEIRSYGDMMRVPIHGKLISSESMSEGKVYKCQKPNCSKIYKNSNGLKYHMEKGSCELEYDSGEENTLPPPETGNVKLAHRPYCCKVAGCGKKYKNLNGLKYHAKAAHVDLDFKSQVKFHKSSHKRLSSLDG